MDTAQLIPLITAIGAIIAAVVAWRNAKSAARKADVDALTATIKTLSSENERLRERLLEYDVRLASLESSETELKSQVATLREENEALRSRVRELENENQRLEKQNHKKAALL